MSFSNETRSSRGLSTSAICLAFTTLLAVASFTGPAAAGWGNDNNRHDDHRDNRQGWNGGGYQPPPVVYYNNPPAYYAPPVVYGQGFGININIP